MDIASDGYLVGLEVDETTTRKSETGCSPKLSSEGGAVVTVGLGNERSGSKYQKFIRF